MSGSPLQARAGQCLWALFVTGLPLAVFPGTFEEFRVSKALFAALVAAPLWILAYAENRRAGDPARALRTAVLAVAAALAFQSLFLREWVDRLHAILTGAPSLAPWPTLDQLAPQATLLIVFLAALEGSARWAVDLRSLRLFAVAPIAMLSIGLVQAWFGVPEWIPRSDLVAFAGTIGNSNELAEWAVPLALLALFARGPVQGQLMVALPCLALLAASDSRGGLLALCAGVLVGLWVTRPCGERPSTLSQASRWTLIACAAASLVALSAHAPTRERVLSALDPNHPTVALRLHLWGTASDALLAHPWLGVGVQRFEAGVEPFRRPTEQAEEWLRLGRHTVIESPHQELLWFATAGGAVGIIALFALCALVWRTARRVQRAGAVPKVQGALAALGAFFVFACIRSPLHHPCGVLVLGLALGQLTASSSTTAQPVAPRSPWIPRRHALSIGTAVLGVTLLLALWPTARAVLQRSAGREGADAFALAQGLVVTALALMGCAIAAHAFLSARHGVARPIARWLAPASALACALLILEDVADDRRVAALREAKVVAEAARAADPSALLGPTWREFGAAARSAADDALDLGPMRAARVALDVADLAALRQALEAQATRLRATLAAGEAASESILRLDQAAQLLPTPGEFMGLAHAVHQMGPVHPPSLARWLELEGVAALPSPAAGAARDQRPPAEHDPATVLAAAIARAPSTPELRRWLAAREVRAGRLERAEGLLAAERALFRRPPPGLDVERGALALRLLGAAERFRIGSEPAVDDPEALATARAALEQGDARTAQREALAALAHSKSRAEALDLIARAGYLWPETQEGVSQARELADLAVAESRLGFAREAEGKGDARMVRVHLRAAVQKAPRHAEVLWLDAARAATEADLNTARERLRTLLAIGVPRAALATRADEEGPPELALVLADL